MIPYPLQSWLKIMEVAVQQHTESPKFPLLFPGQCVQHSVPTKRCPKANLTRRTWVQMHSPLPVSLPVVYRGMLPVTLELKRGPSWLAAIDGLTLPKFTGRYLTDHIRNWRHGFQKPESMQGNTLHFLFNKVHARTQDARVHKRDLRQPAAVFSKRLLKKLPPGEASAANLDVS